MQLINIHQVCEILGYSIHRVKQFIYEENPSLPYYLRKGKFVTIKGKKIEVPKSLGSARRVFVKKEVIKWNEQR